MEDHEGAAVVGVEAAPWSMQDALVWLLGYRSLELSLGSLSKAVCPGSCGFPKSSFPFGRQSGLPGEPSFGAEVFLTMPHRTRWAWGSLRMVGVVRVVLEALEGFMHPGALRLLGTLFRLRGLRRVLGG